MSATDENPDPRRSFRKRVLHVVRRAHLYLGLFLLPWAVLYGVTAVLFNHPAAFADQPTALFGPDAAAGTPLADAPSPAAVAELVVAKLSERHTPVTPYRLAGDARYGREFAFATVKADGQTVSLLWDVNHGGGTVRSAKAVEKAEPERPPFATGGKDKATPKGPRPAPPGDGVRLPDQLHDRLKAAVPAILERTGFPGGEVTVTSVPDIVFPVEADGRVWTASYNPMTGAVTGTPAGSTPPAELSWRAFLLRLHTAHGYPGGDPGAKWYWAAAADVMGVALCFWGLSGLVMWWQIKAARRAGAVVLALGTAAATALGVAMHTALTG